MHMHLQHDVEVQDCAQPKVCSGQCLPVIDNDSAESLLPLLQSQLTACNACTEEQKIVVARTGLAKIARAGM